MVGSISEADTILEIDFGTHTLETPAPALRAERASALSLGAPL